MDSPYIRSKYRKKSTKSDTTITKTQSHGLNENTKNNKNTKSNKKNDLKGGSVLENNQEDKTKFITLAIRKVDNV